MGERTRFNHHKDERCQSPCCSVCAQVLPPPPCRLSPSASCLQILSRHAREGRGGPSTWMGGCPSKMHLLLNLNLHRENKMLLRLLLMAQGTGDSCSTGSPPPPSPPQPPSPPPTPSAVPSALLREPTFVDKPKTTKLVSLV